MSFVESESGRWMNPEHIASLMPQPGGHFTVRWSNGMIENLSSTDGNALRDAISQVRRKPGPKPKAKAS